MTIGIYALCYKDAEWLAFNLRRMYEWVDAISIVIGPVKKVFGCAEDKESEDILRALPDPDCKIMIQSGSWPDKNYMAERACEKLDTEIVVQLDADEVWPKEVFDAAIRAVRAGTRKVRLHMYTFWRTLGYILTTPDVRAYLGKLAGADRTAALKLLEGDRRVLDEYAEHTPWLLDMGRVFRPDQLTRISHIPPDLVWPNGESAYDAVTLGPLWHFSYIGTERVRRKFTFFNKRDGNGGKVMPDFSYFEKWGEENLGDRVPMTGQTRGFRKYDGPEIPADVRAFVEGSDHG